MLTTAAAEAPGAVSQDDIRKRRLNSWPSTNSLGQRPVSEGRGRWGDPEMLSGPSHRRNPTEHQQRLGANKKCSFEGLTLSGTETSWIPSGWALSGPSHETSPWRPAAGGRSAAMERQQSMPALRQSPSLSQNNKSRRLGSIGEDGPWRESVSQSSFRGNRRLAGAASSSTLSVSYSSTPPTEASPRLIRPPGLSLRPKSASWNLRESPDASISGAGARLLKQEPIGLFLLNIPSWVRVPEILNLFTPFGSVVNVGIEAETEPVYAFVDFAADEGRDSAVSRALSELAGRTFFSMDIPLTLAPRFDRTSKPVFPVSEPEPPARESPATFDYQTLYIPALPCHVTKQQLERHFKPYGQIKRAHIAVKPRDNRHFAFITFWSEDAAAKALEGTRNAPGLFDTDSNEPPLRIEYSRVNTPPSSNVRGPRSGAVNPRASLGNLRSVQSVASFPSSASSSSSNPSLAALTLTSRPSLPQLHTKSRRTYTLPSLSTPPAEAVDEDAMEAITLDEIHGAESMLEDGEVLEIVIRLEDII